MQVLVLLAALSTCDPGNILDTITELKQAKARVSIVGLAADVYICDKIAQVREATVVHCMPADAASCQQ